MSSEKGRRGRGTQSLCLRRRPRNNGFPSGVDSACVWSAEQITEIMQKSIDPEFLPTATNVDRSVPNLEFVLPQMYTALMALTRYEANDSAANPRKKPLEAWRKTAEPLGPNDRRKKAKFASHDHSPGKCSLLELRARIERWESYMSRYEKKMRETVDDEFKLSLVWRHWA